ncbi:MAG: twin-arginine translocation signal domain-containing protein [Deltaproteobacteria bacterium]|nr:twin-arginine translocation signal domain-containing protein [Deltaproteobacteria bacterium]
MTSKKKPTKEEKGQVSRRGFLKGAALMGATAVTATAVFKGVVTSKGNSGKAEAAYQKDVLAGDVAMKKGGYEELSKKEIKAMVSFFESNYKKLA